MKTLLSLCIIAVLFISCSNKNGDTVKPATEKKVRIEIEFSGDYQNYQLLFTINSLTKGQGTFVEPLITTPTNTQWTQVVAQGNSYSYIAEVGNPKLIVESKEAVNHVGFLLSATQVKNTEDTTQTPIKAIVKVYADDKIIKTYNYNALPVGQVTQPLSQTLDISSL